MGRKIKVHSVSFIFDGPASCIQEKVVVQPVLGPFINLRERQAGYADIENAS